MNSIISRTIFYETWDNAIRFNDWCKIWHQGLGTCYQPFFVNAHLGPHSDQPEGRRNYDPKDQCQLISNMENIDHCKIDVMVFGDGVKQLHGGRMYPRPGRY